MEIMDMLISRSRVLETEFRQHGPNQSRCAAAMSLMQETAKAGAVVGNLDDRLLLRDMMDYWASILRIALNSQVSTSDIQEILVAPQLAEFTGADVDEDGLTLIALDEFLRMVERHMYITTRKLSRVIMPVTPALLKVSAIEVRFFDCTLSQVRFADESMFIRTGFIKCRMDGVVARKAQFVECRFATTHLEGADFRESNFTRAHFKNCYFDDRTHFRQSTFVFAKLEEVHGNEVAFSEAKMGTIEMSNVELTKCKFDRAELTGAKLWRSDFSESDFSRASLREADVDGALFVGCNLEGANFEGARNIERADFTDSNWRKAKFDPLVAEALEARYPSNVISIKKTGTKE